MSQTQRAYAMLNYRAIYLLTYLLTYYSINNVVLSTVDSCERWTSFTTFL